MNLTINQILIRYVKGKNMKNLINIMIVLLLVITSNVYAEDSKSNIVLNSYAFVEKSVVKNGKEIKEVIEAKNVIPGETVIFKNILKNKDIAKNIVVNNKIPSEIVFSNAYSTDEKNIDIEYSIDGVNYSSSDKLFIKENGQSRLARPEEYQYVRWISKKDLKENSITEFNYKGTLK